MTKRELKKKQKMFNIWANVVKYSGLIVSTALICSSFLLSGIGAIFAVIGCVACGVGSIVGGVVLDKKAEDVSKEMFIEKQVQVEKYNPKQEKQTQQHNSMQSHEAQNNFNMDSQQKDVSNKNDELSM